MGKLTALAGRFPALLAAGWLALAGSSASAQPVEPPQIAEAFAAYDKGDLKGALEIWQSACDEGNPRGCFHAAVVHRDGEGVRADEKRANALFERACEGGFGNACFNLGVGAEGETQIAWFAKGCALPDVGSCARLGMAYRDGKHVDRDWAKAASYLERACRIETMRAGQACFILASLYDKHLEETPILDAATSNRWLDEGCARNDADSCQNLAWHYAHGFGGLETDFVRSAALYQLACDDNAGLLCMMIPARHIASPGYSGREVDKRWRKAAGAYDRACKADLAHGCFAMARLIAKSGDGAKHSDTMRRFLNRAIALDPDHVAAIELLRRVDAGELPSAPMG